MNGNPQPNLIKFYSPRIGSPHLSKPTYNPFQVRLRFSQNTTWMTLFILVKAATLSLITSTMHKLMHRMERKLVIAHLLLTCLLAAFAQYHNFSTITVQAKESGKSKRYPWTTNHSIIFFYCKKYLNFDVLS